jgi:hypothetical protein
MGLIALRCNWCSRWRETSRCHTLKSSQVICDYCIEWHCAAMDFLGGAPPIGCQECGISWEKLRAIPGNRSSIFIVPKDGINQMLCAQCKDAYVLLRSDLYRNTKFGDSIKL